MNTRIEKRVRNFSALPMLPPPDKRCAAHGHAGSRRARARRALNPARLRRPSARADRPLSREKKRDLFCAHTRALGGSYTARALALHCIALFSPLTP